MNWRITVHQEVAKQLRAIPPDRRQRILNDLRELAGDPFRGLVKPVKGKAHKGHYRQLVRWEGSEQIYGLGVIRQVQATRTSRD
jgi:mRNA-degrading endonuclease RelE of RelBE toxin-antitoxin system